MIRDMDTVGTVVQVVAFTLRRSTVPGIVDGNIADIGQRTAIFVFQVVCGSLDKCFLNRHTVVIALAAEPGKAKEDGGK